MMIGLSEEPKETRPVRAVATRGRKRGGAKAPARRSTRSSAAVEVVSLHLQISFSLSFLSF